MGSHYIPMIRNITILIALTLLSNNVMADGDSCLFECAIGKLAYIHSGPMSASTACGKPELKNSLMKYSADGIFTGAYRNINDSSPTK